MNCEHYDKDVPDEGLVCAVCLSLENALRTNERLRRKVAELETVVSAARELLRANNERSGPFESRAEDAAWSKLAIALDGLGEDG